MAMKSLVPRFDLMQKRILQGKHPIDFSLTRSYAPIKVRKKRIRNPDRKPKLKILGRRDIKK